MTWVKLDDAFPDHPKILAVGDEAAWLFVCGLCHSSRHLTDGLVATAVLGRLTGLRRPERYARRLVDAGLWVEVDAGWRVAGYEEWQRTRSDIEAEREAGRERARRSREARAKARRDAAERAETFALGSGDIDTESDADPPNPQGFAEQDDPERLRALTVERATEARDALLNGQASKLAGA